MFLKVKKKVKNDVFFNLTVVREYPETTGSFARA
jgi:hypothetical protein